MKRYKTFAFVTALALLIGTFFLSANQSLAENLKFGYIDLQRVLKDSVRGKRAVSELQTHYEAVQNEAKNRERELQELQLELNKKAALWNEETKKEKEEEYRRLVRDLKRYVADSEQELKASQQEVMQEILQEVATIVASLGEEEGYTMIFVKNPGINPVILYASPAIDITDLAIQRYDAQLPGKETEKK